MKKTFYKFLLVTLFFYCFCGCTDVAIDHSLSITNKSNIKISILSSNRASGHLTKNNIAYFISDQNIIFPDSSFDVPILGRQGAWHRFIDKGKTKKLYLYIFNVDSLKIVSSLVEV